MVEGSVCEDLEKITEGSRALLAFVVQTAPNIF